MSLYFPENIQEEGGRPVITFTCLQGGSGGGGTGGSATFPGPVGLQISDSANYGGVELGALGGTALSAFSKSKDKGIIEGVGGKGGTIEFLAKKHGYEIGLQVYAEINSKKEKIDVNAYIDKALQNFEDVIELKYRPELMDCTP